MTSFIFIEYKMGFVMFNAGWLGAIYLLRVTFEIDWLRSGRHAFYGHNSLRILEWVAPSGMIPHRTFGNHYAVYASNYLIIVFIFYATCSGRYRN